MLVFEQPEGNMSTATHKSYNAYGLPGVCAPSKSLSMPMPRMRVIRSASSASGAGKPERIHDKAIWVEAMEW